MKASILTYTAFAITLLSGCSPIYYSGTTQNVPVFEEKGSFRAGASGNDSRLGGEIAYAFADHVGVAANGAAYFQNEDQNEGKGTRIETGLVFYTRLGEHLRFETMGLVGLGNVDNKFPGTVTDYPGTSGRITANMFTYGVQPALAFRTPFFQTALSLKAFAVNYSSINGSLIYDRENQITYLQNNDHQFIVEPALTIRGGLENIKLQLQFGHSLNLTNSDFRMDDNFLTFGLWFGIK